MDTETEKLAAQLNDARRKISIMHEVSAVLNKLLSSHEKLDAILIILDTQFGLKHSMILLPDKKQEKLAVFASHGYDENVHGQEIPFGQGIIGLAALRKRKINITGIRRKQSYIYASAEGQVAVLPAQPGLKTAESQVAIPLLSNNTLIAVLVAESENFCVFSPEDEAFLDTLAQPMAVSILNSMLYDSMEEKIRERTASLEQVTATKEKFFSIISHDLRSPVTSFQGISKLFRYYNQRGDTSKIEALCSTVDGATERLNHLLDNLLNWSLQQTNGITCRFEAIRLSDFMNEIAAIYRENILSKSLSLQVRINDSIFIRADNNTVATVFRNLLNNAIKFTPRGGTISISAQVNDESVAILVEDNGVGIGREKLHSIFEMKEQKVTCGTEKEKGTGLGLILVKEFIQLNHGTVVMESAGEKGTRVIITLPQASAEETFR
jgi:signal transduction histidine kinase